MTFHGLDVDFGLSGKVALITGGAAGIGRSIAELFVLKGARVVLLDRSDAVEATAEALGASVARGYVADVTRRSEVENAFRSALAEFGQIDILINNAGIVALDPAESLSEAAWDQTMAVNLKGVYLTSQIVGRHMIERHGGKIVNMASQAALVALPNHLAYCASKAAVLGMTRVMAMEWGHHNIQVNCISPTVVMTELGQKAWAGAVGDEMKKKIPAGRFANPEEIAACALFLVSGASGMITGENLVIDGGYTIQ